MQITFFLLIAIITIVVAILIVNGRQDNANDDGQADVDDGAVEGIGVRISEAPKRGAGGGPETQTEPKPDLYFSGIEMQNLPN